MVNKNTSNKTTVNTGTISESSIYLKKSELPKDVSSFRNDAGYISSSALEGWLKAHSYLSKTEIDKLIKNANLTVIDKINREYDDDAIARLNNDIINMKGEIVAIKENMVSGFSSIEGKTENLVTKNQFNTLSNRVTNIKSDVNQINTNISTLAKKSEIPTKVSQLTNDAGYLTKEQDLSAYAKKSDLAGFIKTSDLTPYAKKDWVQNWVEDQGFLKSIEIPDISGLAKKSDLNNYVKTSSLSSYAKKSDLTPYASKDWVTSQGFLTESQDMSDYAKKSDLNGYVKASSLTSTLGKYAKKTDLSGYAKEENVYRRDYIDNNFATKSEVKGTYLTKLDAEKTYLQIEDYRGLKDATVINDTYKDKTIEYLESKLNVLMNGFYIVDGQDVVIVKDHKIINIFKDGTPQTTLEWDESGYTE